MKKWHCNSFMGDSKRRQSSLGDQYRDPDLAPIAPGWPISKRQARAFYIWTTRGAWGGIILLAIFWVVVRFVGPAFGWWHVI